VLFQHASYGHPELPYTSSPSHIHIFPYSIFFLKKSIFFFKNCTSSCVLFLIPCDPTSGHDIETDGHRRRGGQQTRRAGTAATTWRRAVSTHPDTSTHPCAPGRFWVCRAWQAGAPCRSGPMMWTWSARAGTGASRATCAEARGAASGLVPDCRCMLPGVCPGPHAQCEA